MSRSRLRVPSHSLAGTPETEISNERLHAALTAPAFRLLTGLARQIAGVGPEGDPPPGGAPHSSASSSVHRSSQRGEGLDRAESSDSAARVSVSVLEGVQEDVYRRYIAYIPPSCPIPLESCSQPLKSDSLDPAGRVSFIVMEGVQEDVHRRCMPAALEDTLPLVYRSCSRDAEWVVGCIAHRSSALQLTTLCRVPGAGSGRSASLEGGWLDPELSEAIERGTTDIAITFPDAQPG